MGDYTVSTFASPRSPSISTAHSVMETAHYAVAEGRTFNTAAAWPLASTAILIPFQLEVAHLVTSMSWQNGTITTAPNVDVGIYDRAFNREVSLGNTLQATATSIQVGNIADTVLPRGDHYMAMVASGVASQFDSAPISAIVCRAMGIVQMAAASPLPTTITPAISALAYVPYLSLSFGPNL